MPNTPAVMATFDDSSISELDYSRFVGLTRERNRPSGGIRTIQESAIQARIQANSRVLEIGSNTGFTSVNLALLTGASVIGVDVNPLSIQEAMKYADRHGVSDRVHFQRQDARELPFDDGSFDVVWVSNVVSFVADKDRMLSEVTRVLRDGGTVIAVPIYYRRQPSGELLARVSHAVGTEVVAMEKKDWQLFYDAAANLETYYDADFVYDHLSADRVDQYCTNQMKKEHLISLDPESRAQVAEQMRYFMTLFNENLSYAGFSILLMQKRVERDEEELFVSRPAAEGRFG